MEEKRSLKCTLFSVHLNYCLNFSSYFLIFPKKDRSPRVCLCVYPFCLCLCVSEINLLLVFFLCEEKRIRFCFNGITTIKCRRRSLWCLPRCTHARGSRSAWSLARNCSGSGPSSPNLLQSGRFRDGSRSSTRCRTLDNEKFGQFCGTLK